jgi:hypothetical protein
MQWPFEAWGADAVIGGHDHTYERLQVGGIPYFVNGAGGQSLYPFGTPLPESIVRYNKDFGAMLVEADATSIRFRFMNTRGEVIDDVTFPAEAPPPVTPVRRTRWSSDWATVQIDTSAEGWTLSACLHPTLLRRPFCVQRVLAR